MSREFAGEMASSAFDRAGTPRARLGGVYHHDFGPSSENATLIYVRRPLRRALQADLDPRPRSHLGFGIFLACASVVTVTAVAALGGGATSVARLVAPPRTAVVEPSEPVAHAMRAVDEAAGAGEAHRARLAAGPRPRARGPAEPADIDVGVTRQVPRQVPIDPAEILSAPLTEE